MNVVKEWLHKILTPEVMRFVRRHAFAVVMLTGSLAFFAGRAEGGELGVQAILLLGSYPSDVFAGVAKLVLYSVVPAVFVSAIPARLVDDPDAGEALALVAATVVFALLARAVFARGLRRYTSGSVWTRA